MRGNTFPDHVGTVKIMLYYAIYIVRTEVLVFVFIQSWLTSAMIMQLTPCTMWNVVSM